MHGPGLCDYVRNNISHICLWPWFKVLESVKHDRPPQAFNSTPFIAPGVDLVNPHFHLSYYKLGTESDQRNIVLSICFCHCVIYWSHYFYFKKSKRVVEQFIAMCELYPPSKGIISISSNLSEEKSVPIKNYYQVLAKDLLYIPHSLAQEMSDTEHTTPEPWNANQPGESHTVLVT